VTVKRNNYQHYDHVGQTMNVKLWRDDVVSFCNITYTQENSQICNILIIRPNMNMTLVQAYMSECTVKQAEMVFVKCDLIDLIMSEYNK